MAAAARRRKTREGTATGAKLGVLSRLAEKMHVDGDTVYEALRAGMDAFSTREEFEDWLNGLAEALSTLLHEEYGLDNVLVEWWAGADNYTLVPALFYGPFVFYDKGLTWRAEGGRFAAGTSKEEFEAKVEAWLSRIAERARNPRAGNIVFGGELQP